MKNNYKFHCKTTGKQLVMGTEVIQTDLHNIFRVVVVLSCEFNFFIESF